MTRVISSFLLLVLSPLVVSSLAFFRFPANDDEVVDLPGLPSKPAFRQYSGYLNATNNRYLHYWFVESASKPSTDPLLLWMNGGPGCSSLEGFLGEHGPFHVTPGTKKLYNNPYSWNKKANVLYLEAPAGVGFSYSADKNYKTDDDQVSEDNYVALQSFFKKFPQFSTNDFYITGESYGGIYVPTLSVRVLTGKAPIKFKGFAVGNGLSSFPLNDNSVIFFYYHHGLFGKTTWDVLVKHCCNGAPSQQTCNFHDNNDVTCRETVSQVSNHIMNSGINPYDLYDTCNNSAAQRVNRLRVEAKHLFKYYNLKNTFNAFKSKPGLKEDPPCVSDKDLADYLNQKIVRSALHIPNDVQDWEICSGEVASTYKTIYQNMTKQYNVLLSKVRGLVYNGDVDMMCNFLGDQWFVDSLNRKLVADYNYWKVDDQVGGFVKRFDNLDFVTIKGAGHMVPTNKPKEAYKMINSFLSQTPY